MIAISIFYINLYEIGPSQLEKILLVYCLRACQRGLNQWEETLYLSSGVRWKKSQPMREDITYVASFHLTIDNGPSQISTVDKDIFNCHKKFSIED